MFNFELKTKAAREIERLPSQIRKRILEKLKFYSSQENPLRFAEKLKDRKFGEYRFRIGNYRVLFDIENYKIIILKVGIEKTFIKIVEKLIWFFSLSAKNFKKIDKSDTHDTI